MGIATRQNAADMLRLQKARRVLYGQVKTLQGWIIGVTLLLPVASATAAALRPECRPYVAIAALLLVVLDASFFDRWVKRSLNEGAKLQEEFDCSVYELGRNKFVTGGKVDAEDVAKYARRPLKARIERTFRDWYSPSVDEIPLSAGRVVCQRSNLRFDISQRRQYSSLLTGAIVAIVVSTILLALYLQLALPDAVLTFGAPLTPIVNWLLRERNRHVDTTTTVERLKGESEKLWDEILRSADDVSFESKTRELQDAIFNFRATSPLVFDWVYGLLRTGLESDMLEGAHAWVDEYKKARAVKVV
ncbi:S-4TM family putative pore-forming effector [Paraburkholderia azotifigens]|uniref:DUF4231 domain-containing protein n=1 Tax=Paraburkholderia azotifigens TaxID=2057004 RepID=A0A5C6V0I2_9BURK|nr:S-4TM family putative pore-forming effector [Paraburkholderia azotifigens]TXC79122.1 hypothetical protein FRZ40_32405 [Paraburkholderia azotifigens]